MPAIFLLGKRRSGVRGREMWANFSEVCVRVAEEPGYAERTLAVNIRHKTVRRFRGKRA
jgi:hypothetical protein